MSDLTILANERHTILLAEIAALIHDLGKLSREFIFAKAAGGQGDDVHHLFLKRYPPQVTDALKGHSTDQNRVETALRYLESINIPEAADMKNYLSVEYQANPQLYLEGALKTYVGKSLQAADLATQVQTIVDEHKKLSHPRYGELTLAERIAQVPSGFLPGHLINLLNDLMLPGIQSDAGPPLLSETIIGEIIEGHHSPPAPWRIKKSEYLSILRAGEGADGFDSWIDKGQVSDEAKQPVSHTFIATAFGYEPESQRITLDTLTDVRHRYANALTTALQRIREAERGLSTAEWTELLCDPKTGLRARTEAAFRQALGETRRSANDVTLWDHCYSTASLYKAALAKVLLEDSWTEPAKIGWRFLRVAVDGPAFWGQAHHVTDMLGRRAALTEALDRVRHALEITYPVGNEIYHDENGSVFVMPALERSDLYKAFVKKVEERACTAFDAPDAQEVGISGELVPHLFWNAEGAVRKGKYEEGGKVRDDGFPSMVTAFGDLVHRSIDPVAASTEKMAGWWQESGGREICTVCGVRPVGYKPSKVDMAGWVDPEKAEKRHVCCVCLNRRGRRAEHWLTKEDHRTIWADEVVDVNGRFALIVGHFDLDQWLDGTLVRTMLTAFHPDEEEPEKRLIPKNPSPARIRRCWETTRKFWQEVEPEAILGTLDKRTRLEIIPQNKKELADGLRAYHTYELDISGQRVGVVWDPISKHLLTTEHLADLVRRWNVPVGDIDTPFTALQKWLQRHPVKTWSLYEPSGYGEPAREKEQDVVFDDAKGSDTPYTPHIPLLTEPALFMALVPADRAMDIVQAIKQKYEREMSKVRDRLPLHLGVVIAPRRTPIRAVLEAGRAMLGARGEGPGARGWEEWVVVEKPKEKTGDEAPDYLTEGNQHFERWWDVPLKKNGREIHLHIGAVMGDGETKDQWYPHLLTRRPKAEEENFEDQPWKRPIELEKGDGVWIAPSTFDFEFLDTTARRFEIAYDQTGQRRGRPTRPYLLEEIKTLQQVWDLISDRLSTTQWMALDGLIERKRDKWHEPRGTSGQYSGPFERFVEDTLRNAEWKQRPDKKEFTLLKDAAQWGVLNDVIDLYHEAMKE
jgi:hypothetical protein